MSIQRASSLPTRRAVMSKAGAIGNIQQPNNDMLSQPGGGDGNAIRGFEKATTNEVGNNSVDSALDGKQFFEKSARAQQIKTVTDNAFKNFQAMASTIQQAVLK